MYTQHAALCRHATLGSAATSRSYVAVPQALQRCVADCAFASSAVNYSSHDNLFEMFDMFEF
jgi:hypothetical protein